MTMQRSVRPYRRRANNEALTRDGTTGRDERWQRAVGVCNLDAGHFGHRSDLMDG